jgi:hypothetical protein
MLRELRLVIDDDASIREALGSLFRSVDLKVQLFARLRSSWNTSGPTALAAWFSRMVIATVIVFVRLPLATVCTAFRLERRPHPHEIRSIGLSPLLAHSCCPPI